jgi:hypothetical protein
MPMEYRVEFDEMPQSFWDDPANDGLWDEDRSLIEDEALIHRDLGKTNVRIVQRQEEVEPEEWDIDRLQEEYSDLLRTNARNAHEADKQRRRKGYYISSIAPLLRVRDEDEDAGTVTIPLTAWRQFCSDLAAISYGRTPATVERLHEAQIAAIGQHMPEPAALEGEKP